MSTAHFGRRATLRHDVRIRGAIIITLAGTTRTVGCLIIDLSLGGAKIELDKDWLLPDELLLFESHQENIYECSVRWKDGRTVGLSFLDQLNLSARRALIEEVSLGLVDAMRSGDLPE
jgi:hypothetical protein